MSHVKKSNISTVTSHGKMSVSLVQSETFISNESDHMSGVLTKGIISVKTGESYSVNDL